MSRRGGSGLFLFDSSETEYRALDKQTKNRQETNREGESSLSRVSGNMPKEQQASIYSTGGTLLHLPSSPYHHSSPSFFTFLSEKFQF
jgi:hypothetical protein